MLKKAISKDAGESTPEGGTDRTSWGRSPVHWILANGKTPPALRHSENLNRYVEDFDEPRTKLAGFFSILLEESAFLKIVFVDDGGRFGGKLAPFLQQTFDIFPD